MASPSFVAAGTLFTYDTDGAASGSVAVPAGVSDGDYLLLVVRNLIADATITPPSGWTAITAANHAQTSVNQSDLMLYERTASSEPGSYTVSNSGNGASNNRFAARIFAWSAATLETSDKWQASGASTTIACPSLTSGGADRKLICIYGNFGNSPNAAPITAPSGMTERANFVDSWSQAARLCFGVADLDISSSGATGTKNATCTDGSAWMLASSVLIQTSGGGGATSTPSRNLSLLGVG